MNATESSPELADALNRFRNLFDPEEINARQAHGANTVYTPWVVVWLLVYQRLQGNASLNEAVDEFLRIANPLPLKRPSVDSLPLNRRIDEDTLSANSGAYSRARTRLEAQVADDIADHVFDTLMKATPPSWQKRRVFMIDGTTSKLTPNAALPALYPPASNQHGLGVWPIVHWAVAHELSSGCAVRPETGAMYGPNAVGEVELAQRLLARIPEKSVLMADRNFGVLAMFYEATQAGHDVVTRLTEARFRSMVRQARRVGPGRWKLAWRPSRAERIKHPKWPADLQVAVTLHERPMTDGAGDEAKLWLVTTLASSGLDLADLYRQRLHVETDISDVKVALKMEELRGHSADMVRKELALGMVAYNLVVQTRRLAAQRIGLEPRRLSFKGVWSLVRTLLLSPNEWPLEKWAKTFDRVLRKAGQRKLPKRPGRKYRREVLPRGRKFPNRTDITKEPTPK